MRFARRCGGGAALAVMALAVGAVAGAQEARRPLDAPLAGQAEGPRHRTRLILRDGSYQTVLNYKVVGDRVRYLSAERNGETEEVPLALVDLPATEAWARAHDPDAAPAAAQAPPVLSPELAREEAARAAQTPEVAKDLRLPEDDSVLVLDTYRGTPELVPLAQYGSDLNRETAHEVARKEINPAASPHDLMLLKEERADVQVHVAEPVFYVRLDRGKAADDASGGSFVVDTEGHGAGRATPSGGSAASGYVLEHVDVRQGARALASLRLGLLGTGRQQPDVVELRAEVLPGGYWERLTPEQPLEFGEWALVEVLDGRAINADVWEFGVHPTAKENDEAMRPEPKRPARLERRGRP